MTTHPGFRAAVSSIASLYDMQHDPAHHERLCYPSPSSGEPAGRSFLIPRNREDLVSRRTMTKTWADATGGMLGRSADFLNSRLTAWAAKADYFAQQSLACRERDLLLRSVFGTSGVSAPPSRTVGATEYVSQSPVGCGNCNRMPPVTNSGPRENRSSRHLHLSSMATHSTSTHHPLGENNELYDGVPCGEGKVKAKEICSEHRQWGLCGPIFHTQSFGSLPPIFREKMGSEGCE